MLVALDIHEGCGGKLELVGLSSEERIERRLGRSWLTVCERCGDEVIVSAAQWREHVWKQPKGGQQLSSIFKPMKG